MKHKKMQKKSQDDTDDNGDLNEDSDVTFDEHMTKLSEERLTNDASSSLTNSGYDIECLVMKKRSASATCTETNDDSADEIDVVESDDEKS